MNTLTLLDMPISTLSNSAKAKEILKKLEKKDGPKTIGRLCSLTEDGLRRIGFSSKKDIELLKKLLTRHNLYLHTKCCDNITKQSTVEELELSGIVTNSLLRSGIYTIEDVCSYPKEYLLSIRNIGKNKMQELINILEKHGFYLIEYSKIKVDDESYIEDLRIDKIDTHYLNCYNIKKIKDLRAFTLDELNMLPISNCSRKIIKLIFENSGINFFDPIEKGEITLSSRIENLNLNKKILSVFFHKNIKTISQICSLTLNDLNKITAFNQANIEMIQSALAKHSFSLKKYQNKAKNIP